MRRCDREPVASSPEAAPSGSPLAIKVREGGVQVRAPGRSRRDERMVQSRCLARPCQVVPREKGSITPVGIGQPRRVHQMDVFSKDAEIIVLRLVGRALVLCSPVSSRVNTGARS